MGNFQIGLSLILPIFTLFLGLLLNRLLPDLWKKVLEEKDRNDQIVSGIVLFAIVMSTIVIMGVFLYLGTTIIGIPDLPSAQPLNISLKIDTTSGITNFSYIDCTPKFSCEKFCSCPDATSLSNFPSENVSCNPIVINNPIFLSLPIERSR